MSASRDCIISVDQSTSASKVMLFDRSGRPIHRVSLVHRQYYPLPGRIEHDPLEILENVKSAIEKVLLDSEEGTTPRALAITNQRETVVAWDRQTGRPIGRAIVWQDQRGMPICQRLRQEGRDAAILKKTGLLLDSYFSASKLATLVKEDEEAAAALRAGRLMAGTMDGWLIWNLTDRREFCIDYSNASRTMLFDIHRLCWDEELLEVFGLRGLLLPDVRCSDARFGEARSPRRIEGLPIAGVMGDSHAALFGHCGWHEGDIKATYGTGTSIMRNIGESPRPPGPGIVLSLGWGFQGRPSYVFEGNIHSTGDTISWLRDNLGLFDSYEEAEALAAEIRGNGGVYLVPAFAGLGAPHWVHGIGALITGLTRDSGRGHIIRAGLESIAYQVRDLVEAMAEKAALPKCLHAGGGATRNRFLMQFQADMLGIPVRASQAEEISA
ncbi:MAG TPA: FGGY family carbohydrate kinase, partial [Spirochaetia bacterium]|nr:FGGY family carbohydrate kinase [Spirochaetia bacterium]